jgi:hypothetical protein
MFGQNLGRRITEGIDERHVKSVLHYWTKIPGTSLPFLLFLPAGLFTIFAACDKRAAMSVARGERRNFGLIAAFAVGWVALFSASPSKSLHYTYPAFPAIALAIAATIAAIAAAVATFLPSISTAPRWTDHSQAVVMLLAAAGLLLYCPKLVYAVLPGVEMNYIPWEIYQTFQPAIDTGRMRLVRCGFPATRDGWRSELTFDSKDCLYLEHMRGATAINTPEELAQLLDDGTPALVLLSKRRPWGSVRDALLRGARVDPRFVFEHESYTVAGVNLSPVLSPEVNDGESNAYLETPTGRFRDQFVVRVNPPLPQKMELTVRVRFARDIGTDLVRCRATTSRRRTEEQFIRPLPEVQEITAPLFRFEQDYPAAGSVTFSFDRPGSPDGIVGTVEGARLRVRPRAAEARDTD